MTKPTTDELRAAYALGGYRETRAQLRRLVSPLIEDQARHFDLPALIETSPICGDEGTQMKIRPTWSALRDALDLDTLTALCVGSFNFGEVVSALEHPEDHGTRTAKSKTGYVFGRPRVLTAEMAEANKAEIMADKEPTAKHEPSTFGLQDIINVHDHVTDLCGVSTNDLFWAMRKYHTTEEWFDKLTAAQNMIDLRGEAEKVPYHDLPERVKNCIALTEAQFDDDASGGMVFEFVEEEPTVAKYELPAAAESSLIDLALKNAKLPPIATLIEEINGASAKIAEAQAKAEAEASLMASASASDCRVRCVSLWQGQAQGCRRRLRLHWCQAQDVRVQDSCVGVGCTAPARASNRRALHLPRRVPAHGAVLHHHQPASVASRSHGLWQDHQAGAGCRLHMLPVPACQLRQRDQPC